VVWEDGGAVRPPPTRFYPIPSAPLPTRNKDGYQALAGSLNKTTQRRTPEPFVRFASCRAKRARIAQVPGASRPRTKPSATGRECGMESHVQTLAWICAALLFSPRITDGVSNCDPRQIAAISLSVSTRFRPISIVGGSRPMIPDTQLPRITGTSCSAALPPSRR
jgi:hypothetical protein